VSGIAKTFRVPAMSSAGSVLWYASKQSLLSAWSADSVRGRPADARQRRILLVVVVAALPAVCVRRLV
jgi:hypothetical protein